MFRTTTRRRAAVVAVVATLALTAAACGSDSKSDSSTATTAAAATTTSAAAGSTTSAGAASTTAGSAVSTPSTGGDVPADPPAALVQAAEGEGSVTMYASFAETTGNSLVEAFEKKYPKIDATYVRTSGGDGYTKFLTEAQSGKPVADLYSNPSLGYMEDAKAKGVISDFGAADVPNVAAVPENFRGDFWATVSVSAFGMCYNTDRVEESELPKTWAGAGDPAFKDQTLLPDPTNIEVYVNTWESIRRVFGDEVLTEVAANKPQIIASLAPAIQSLAAGEGDILVMCSGSFVPPLKAQGAPIDFYEPTGGAFGSESYAVLANGPHPNAGKLLMNFLLSPEATAVFTQDPGVYSVTALPDDYHPTLNVAAEVKPQILSLLGIG